MVSVFPFVALEVVGGMRRGEVEKPLWGECLHHRPGGGDPPWTSKETVWMYDCSFMTPEALPCTTFQRRGLSTVKSCHPVDTMKSLRALRNGPVKLLTIQSPLLA